MATDQGRTSNLNGLQLVSNIENKIVPEVGHTTFRPPFTPVTIGTIVGREVGKHFMPTRLTPMHNWHIKNNAVFVDAGAWKRPRYYKIGPRIWNGLVSIMSNYPSLTLTSVP